MTQAVSREKRWAIPAVLAVGCAAPAPDLVARGRELVSSHELSAASTPYTCTSCHDETKERANPDWRKPGATLAGATLRPSYWGGQELDLLRAIDACRESFMRDDEPLRRDDPDTEALYAYLLDLEPGDPEPFAFTVEAQNRPAAAR